MKKQSVVQRPVAAPGTTTRRPMATRATPAQVRLHIVRQRFLGERMLADHDRPRPVELAVTALGLVCLFFIV